jgi:hypothetical protein
VRVVRIEPERLVEQLPHRRQHALAGEVEVVHQPPLANEEAHELLGGRDVVAILEDHCRRDGALDRESLASRAEWPFDRGGVLVVVVGPVRLERVDDRERLVLRHHHGLREERLVVAVAGGPVHCIGRRAALPVKGGVAVDGHDELAPDRRVVDDEAAVAGDVLPLVSSKELEEPVLGVHPGPHRQADAPDVVTGERLAHRRLHLVAPERPESVPFIRNVPESEPRLLQEALPDVNVVGHAAHRQPVQGFLPGASVEPPFPAEHVRIEHVGKVADGVREIHEPVVEGPWSDMVVKIVAEGEVRRLAGLERRIDRLWMLVPWMQDQLDLLAGLLLEGGDDLPDRLVLLRVVALIPPHDEVGGPSAERRHHEHRCENYRFMAQCRLPWL